MSKNKSRKRFFKLKNNKENKEQVEQNVQVDENLNVDQEEVNNNQTIQNNEETNNTTFDYMNLDIDEASIKEKFEAQIESRSNFNKTTRKTEEDRVKTNVNMEYSDILSKYNSELQRVTMEIKNTVDKIQRARQTNRFEKKIKEYKSMISELEKQQNSIMDNIDRFSQAQQEDLNDKVRDVNKRYYCDEIESKRTIRTKQEEAYYRAKVAKINSYIIEPQQKYKAAENEIIRLDKELEEKEKEIIMRYEAEYRAFEEEHKKDPNFKKDKWNIKETLTTPKEREEFANKIKDAIMNGDVNLEDFEQFTVDTLKVEIKNKYKMQAKEEIEKLKAEIEEKKEIQKDIQEKEEEKFRFLTDQKLKAQEEYTNNVEKINKQCGDRAKELGVKISSPEKMKKIRIEDDLVIISKQENVNSNYQINVEEYNMLEFDFESTKRKGIFAKLAEKFRASKIGGFICKKIDARKERAAMEASEKIDSKLDELKKNAEKLNDTTRSLQESLAQQVNNSSDIADKDIAKNNSEMELPEVEDIVI